METYFNLFLIFMAVLGFIVFIALHYVDAGYGFFISKKWGLSIPNKLGWFLMESPVFFLMYLLWAHSDRQDNLVLLVFLLLFQLHYFHRALIFPFLMKGNSQMPISIIFLGVFFNVLNAIMQGGWLFYISPENLYTTSWFYSPQFIIGTIIFVAGIVINFNSDHIIRNLRKPGDKKHYFPQQGMFKYVSSANYFGEVLEWTGFAILTWSYAGAVFAWWTFANLAPRATKLNQKYAELFPDEYGKVNPKKIIPFIY